MKKPAFAGLLQQDSLLPAIVRKSLIAPLTQKGRPSPVFLAPHEATGPLRGPESEQSLCTGIKNKASGAGLAIILMK